MHCLIFVVICLSSLLGCCSLETTKEDLKQENINEAILQSDNQLLFRLSVVDDDAERGLGVVDMGRMTSGEIVVGKIYFENGFDKPLVLLGVNASCGCLSFEYDKLPLKVGEKREIKYRYDSKTKQGKQYSTVGIKTSEGGYELKAECDVKENN